MWLKFLRFSDHIAYKFLGHQQIYGILSQITLGCFQPVPSSIFLHHLKSGNSNTPKHAPAAKMPFTAGFFAFSVLLFPFHFSVVLALSASLSFRFFPDKILNKLRVSLRRERSRDPFDASEVGDHAFFPAENHVADLRREDFLLLT